MFREIIISFLFVGFSVTAHSAALESNLTGKTLITAENVTVGDLFTNTGKHADHVLAPAPSAMKPLILSKKDLQRVAAYFQLNWTAPAEAVTLVLKGPANIADEDNVLVPAMLNAVAPGTMINETDLQEIAIPRDGLHAGLALKKSDLVGLVVRRSLMPNQPILNNDVTQPLMVKRNELVTVTYKSGTIRLTTKAVASENATQGQTITLTNALSKKPFLAVISGPQQAEIVINQDNS